METLVESDSKKFKNSSSKENAINYENKLHDFINKCKFYNNNKSRNRSQQKCKTEKEEMKEMTVKIL